MMLLTCQKCRERFDPGDEDMPEYQTKLCYYCFEDSIEEYEEKKRERIARKNEY